MMTFLIANMVYTDALVALFAFGGIYAAGTFGWQTLQIGTFGILAALFRHAGCVDRRQSSMTSSGRRL